MKQKSMKAEEYLNEQRYCPDGEYFNIKTGEWDKDYVLDCEDIPHYKELVIQEYRDSLIDRDAQHFINGMLNVGNPITESDINIIVEILQAKHQKQLEGMIRINDALSIVEDVIYGKYPVCDKLEVIKKKFYE